MVMWGKYINWFDEELDKFYEHDNNGFIHGTYFYEADEEFPFYVEWFKTEEQARKKLLTFGD